MRWSEIPRQPPPTTLRWFSVLWAVVLVGGAGWQFFLVGNKTVALILLGLAFVVGVVGVLVPAGMCPLFVGALMLTFPLHWLFSHLLLAALYYCLFTPLGLFFSLIGRDVLAFRCQPGRDTYWAPKPGAEDVRSYFRQS